MEKYYCQIRRRISKIFFFEKTKLFPSNEIDHQSFWNGQRLTDGNNFSLAEQINRKEQPEKCSSEKSSLAEIFRCEDSNIAPCGAWAWTHARIPTTLLKSALVLRVTSNHFKMITDNKLRAQLVRVEMTGTKQTIDLTKQLYNFIIVSDEK